ncbi:hypothetical protein [Caldanaerobacter sp.]|uniref:hypothetical protein n=1 Tax=Caldanaerobacter sp. TaxID=2930036 RepID=UPI003C786F61
MKTRNINTDYRWILHITLITFFMATFLNFFSDVSLKKSTTFVAFFILAGIVAIGIVFEIIGTAVMSGKEEPFHAMAAKKVYGAKHAIKLLRNANLVATFCYDLIGDISAIISGAALMSIIMKFPLSGTKASIYTAFFAGILSSVIIGGKAIAKSIGMLKSQTIVYWTGVVLAWMEKNLGINILPDYKNNKKKKRK